MACTLSILANTILGLSRIIFTREIVALANDLYAGPVPDALKDLSVVKECMIACRRAKVFVIHLNDVNDK